MLSRPDIKASALAPTSKADLARGACFNDTLVEISEASASMALPN